MAIYQSDLPTEITQLNERINELRLAASSKGATWIPNITSVVASTEVAPVGFMDWSILPNTPVTPVTVVNGLFMLEIWAKAKVTNSFIDLSYRVYPANDYTTTAIGIPILGDTQGGISTWTDFTTTEYTIFPGNIRQINTVANGEYFVELFWRKNRLIGSTGDVASLGARTIITRTL